MNPCKPHQTEFVVRESCAPNKSSWKWKHRRVNVAVLYVNKGVTPKMISLRARGVREIVWFRGSLFDGRSLRCQASVARARAEEIADKLNSSIERTCAGLPARGGFTRDGSSDCRATGTCLT